MTNFPGRFLAVFGLLLALGALVACTEGDAITVTGPDDAAAHGISVSGMGEVVAPSDTGYLSVGVQSDAATVAEARERAAKAAEAVISSLTGNGIDKKDIKTSNLSIYPRYDNRPGANGEPRIIGYTVTNIVEVKVRKLDTFSKVVDDAVAAGGDDTRLNNIWFGIEDTEALAKQAREAAVKDARAKAEQLATASGVQLGDPIAISEVQAPNPPIIYSDNAARLSNQSTSTPIEPGTGKITVTLTVRFTIRPS